MFTKEKNNEVLDFQNEISSNASTLLNDSPNRILHVYYEGKWQSGLSVIDSDKSTVLYNVELNCRKPHMVITSASTGAQIGAANYHTWKARIDATIHNQPLTLNTKGLCCLGTYTFGSHNHDSTLTWKPQRFWEDLDMALLDDKKERIANFKPVTWAKKKSGRIELIHDRVRSQEEMDEVVMTALAIMYFKHMQRRTAGAAAAASA